jgi:large subunit ribosomal protein L18
VDDDAGRVVLGVSSVAPTFAGLREPGRGKQEVAREVGRELAKRAREGGIETAVFDRSGYRYHGRVKACAEGAREAGLKF